MITKQIKSKVMDVLALAATKYGCTIKYEDLEIKFKPHGRAAGQAWAKRTRHGTSLKYGLNFSLESANLDINEMLNDTVPHEVAHLVCFADPSLGRNHDAGWQRVCIGLGGTGNRTHTQELTKARYKSQYVYTLDNGEEHRVGPKVHKKIRMGATYRARKSGLPITAAHFTRVITPEQHRREHQMKVAAYASAQGAAQTPAKPKAATSHIRPKAKPARTTTPPVGRWTSKLSHCSCLFDPNASRADNIAKFVRDAGCTKAGAATYYAKIKKERS